MKSWLKSKNARSPQLRSERKFESSGASVDSARSSHEAYRDLGDAARDQRDWAVAAGFYHQHLSERENDADIWVQLGNMLKESNRLDEARSAYEQAIKIAPKSADAHLQFGHVLKLQGFYAEAAQSYGEAQKLDPTSRDIAIEIRSIMSDHLLTSSTDFIKMSMDEAEKNYEERETIEYHKKTNSSEFSSLLLAHKVLSGKEENGTKIKNSQEFDFATKSYLLSCSDEKIGEMLHSFKQDGSSHHLAGLESRIFDDDIKIDTIKSALEFAIMTRNYTLAIRICKNLTDRKIETVPTALLFNSLVRLSEAEDENRKRSENITIDAIMSYFAVSRDIIVRQRNLIIQMLSRIS